MRKCRNWQTSKTKDLVSIALVWVQVPSSAVTFFRMKGENYIMNERKCRNWQTSKTKDLVSIALVWVQVPSSAFIIRKDFLKKKSFFVYKIFYYTLRIEKNQIKNKKIKGNKKVLSNNINEEIQNVLF